MQSILHHDIALGYAVLNKPSGVDTFSFVQRVAVSVLDLFRGAAFSAAERKKIDNAHAVHRLDKPTSGCLVVGLTSSARRRLSTAIQKHGMQKTYLAVLRGVPMMQDGMIEAPLREERVQTNRNGYSVMRVDYDFGKPATTSLKVLSNDGERSLVELSPITGRTHQLRAHCALIGCPIVGDPWYPSAQESEMMLHLHAHKIKMPEQNFRGIEVVAKIPEHMRLTLANLPAPLSGVQ